ncbi:MAG: ABC transporter permease [Planctomycetaceae bacterium]
MISYGLTRRDFQNILQLVPRLSATPMREIATTAWYGGRQFDVRILGVTPAYQEINHLEMSHGRFWQADLDRSENICVLGANTAESLFGYEEPLGRAVQLHFNFTSALFTVVGVTRSRNPSAAIGGSLEGRDYNSDVYIRWKRFGESATRSSLRDRAARKGRLVQLSQVTATVKSINEVEGAADTVRDVLARLAQGQ